MKAMIFAAGKGTRLGDITSARPKALLEIKGKTALRIAVEKLTSQGFDEIIINVHHHADQMIKAIEDLKNEGFKLNVSDEREQLLETGGGLYKARWFFDDRPFLLYNVDIITDIDLNELFSYHEKKGGIATLAVRKHNDKRVFLVDEEKIVRGWRNKATGEEIVTVNFGNLQEMAFSGIHIVEPAIFRYMKEGFYSMTSLYLEIALLEKIFVFNHNPEYFFDIGSPEELQKASNHYKQV